MLGTDLLALAALEARGSLAVVTGQDVVVIIVLIPIVKGRFQVVAGEQLNGFTGSI